MFVIGATYQRKEIHRRFGGQWQSGIATPAGQPFIILFSGSEGAQYGYADSWTADGVFRYVGEGQTGDMHFKGGNKAVRDHSLNGKDLLLFQTQGKGKGVRFVGTFGCASWEFSRGPDKNEKERQTIVFNLIREASEDSAVEPSGLSDQIQARDVQALKAAAYAAASTASKGASGEARRTYYRRCAAIKDYVLARAAGTCESCKKPAPFSRRNGTPYLEPHHTQKLSDGGPDHPRWVAAICPNCHREIHFGEEGVVKNRSLVAALEAIES